MLREVSPDEELDSRLGLVPDPVAPDPMLGRIIDKKYEIKRLIGSGGMGSVYEAHHRLIGKRVAVKVLHRELCSNAEIVQRFVREARAATAIGHPHIVEVFDMGAIEGGGFFQVLELLEGKSLGDDLESNGPLTYARAVKILSQVADALAATHDKGIVHRDLKPDNVFLVPRPGDPDFVKLLDFGIAKMADVEGAARTRTGMTLGTAAYMSPEQARGASDIDLRTDVFALGVMTFELLAGVRPFQSDSYAGIILQICAAQTPLLSQYRGDVPPGLQVAIERMMAKSREERFPDCRAVKAALAPFASHGEAPLTVRSRDTAMARLSTLPGEEGLAPVGVVAGSPVSTGPLVASVAPPVPVPVVAAASSTVISADTIPGVRHPLRVAVAAGAVGLACALAVTGWAMTVQPASSGIAATELAGSGLAASGTTPRSAPSPEAPTAVSSRITLRAEPADAALFVDDVAVANPYVVEVVASGDAHIVEARLEGYATARRAVSFTRPLDVTLALEPEQTSASASAATAPPSTPASTGRHGRHGRTDPAPAEVAPSPREPGPAPVAAGPEPRSEPAPAPQGEPTSEPTPEAPAQALKRVRF